MVQHVDMTDALKCAGTVRWSSAVAGVAGIGDGAVAPAANFVAEQA
jgi:hypothetical protein